MKSLKIGFIYVLASNIINMVFNILLNIILPHFLSIDSYAVIKTYQLYVSYVGLFHLGFVDGMYLRYGGNCLADIRQEDLCSDLHTLRCFQLLIVLFIVGYAIAFKTNVILFFAFSILPLNMMSYYKQLYQATGEYAIYGKIISLSTMLIFLADIIILCLRKDNGYLFLLANCLVYIAVWLVLEIRAYKLVRIVSGFFSFSFGGLWGNIRLGLPLTVGNLSSILLTGMDRWFIKLLMNTYSFAQYSFAVSMEGLLNVVVIPITITLYNYFCKIKEEQQIIFVRNCIMIFSAFFIVCAFPAAMIIDTFLDKYKNAATVMFLLFASQMFYIVIKAIYVNLYKAQKRQREYFKKLLFMIAIGFFTNIVFYLIFMVMECFAIGTLVTAMSWFVMCVTDFRAVRYRSMELFYMFAEVVVFLICGLAFHPFVGMIVYIAVTFSVSKVILPEEVNYLIKKIKGTIINSIIRI